MTPLLEVRDLRVSFPGRHGRVQPVDGVSFTVGHGETVALVGESGSGKSLTSLALLQLIPPPGRIEQGSVVCLGGTDLLPLTGEALRRVRGRRIGMVFQDPMTSLNPVLTIGDQVAETIRAHLPGSARQAADRAVALLGEVGLAEPALRARQYPHQRSGGMRQRALIAIALAAEPELLVADEPTSALDVTVQAQILELLDRLRASRRLSVLLITHDLGVVAGRADRTLVMYAGRLVETGPTAAVFGAPAHPYTRGLLASLPSLRGPRRPLVAIPGNVPDPSQWPDGCRFRPRCPLAEARCGTQPPELPVGEARRAACWLAGTAGVAAP